MLPEDITRALEEKISNINVKDLAKKFLSVLGDFFKGGGILLFLNLFLDSPVLAVGLLVALLIVAQKITNFIAQKEKPTPTPESYKPLFDRSSTNSPTPDFNPPSLDDEEYLTRSLVLTDRRPAVAPK